MERSQHEFIARFDGTLSPEKANQFVSLVEEEISEWQIGQSKIYDVQHWLDPNSSDVHFTVRLTKAIDERTAQNFHQSLKDELEFGDLRDQRYHKVGWGMGKARVMHVERIVR